jgi:putative RecB family exonuclease
LALERPAYLSPSSIETFQQCPLKYKLSKIDKLEEGPTEATTLGKFVHAVLENLYNLPADQRTLVSAKAIMRALWDESIIEDGAILPSWREQAEAVVDPESLKKYRWRAWWCIEAYFKMEDPTLITPGGIETALLTEIEGVPIKGFVDRWDPLDDGISIVDYKTGKLPWKKDHDKKFQQLLIYADGLAQELDLPARQVNLLYVKDGVRLQRDVTQPDIDKMRRTVTSTWQAVTVRCSDASFEPTVNVFCDWCTYKPICPAWN